MELDYSKETLEILGKTPSILLRYGLSVFFLILIGILVGISKIDYHDTFSTQVAILDASKLNQGLNREIKYIGYMTVRPLDVSKIKEGSNVIISLNQYPKMIYGVVSGYIISYSLNNEKIEYDVYIELPNGLTTSFDKELEYLQEMRGIAVIKGEKKSILKRILPQYNTPQDQDQ